jgi:hypothetical protein
LLVDILAKVSVNANLITADEQGIHWNAIRQAAKVIKQLEDRSPHGDANFNFGAIAMMKPYGPYYPGSYHLGKGHAFAIAMEGAEVVGDVFRQYQDPVQAEKHLSEVLSNYTKQIEAVALPLAKSTGWSYEGIDATPAPLADRSIGTAIENFTGVPFRLRWHQTAAGIITEPFSPRETHRLLRSDDSCDGGQWSGEALVRRHVHSGFDPGLFRRLRRRR